MTWVRAGEDLPWPEMPAGTVAAATVFMPSSEGEHGQGGRADVMDLDQEVVVVGDDTPPRTDMVERARADGGGGDTVLEEAPRMVPEGTPQVQMSEALLVVGPQAAPVAEPVMVPARALAAGGKASGEHALVLRSGGRQAVGSQPTRSGTSEVFFGPPTQEEAAMAAVTRRLRGRTDRIQAFALAEVEATQELERAFFLSFLLHSAFLFFRYFFFVGVLQRTHWV